MTIRDATFAGILAVTPLGLPADEYRAGELVIANPMAYETAPSAMAGGGYLTITNAGSAPDRLLGVRADFPRVELHSTVEEDGVARMRPIDEVELLPGETIALEPGGLHVMFMGLDGDPFEPGEKVPATLVFERAGDVDVTFTVVERDGDGTMHHQPSE